MQPVESWDTLRGLHLMVTIAMPIALFYIGRVAMDRRSAMDGRLKNIEDMMSAKLAALENRVSDLIKESRDGRKECSEDIRAIMAQLSEYPRRRELQEAVSEIWRDIRSSKRGAE